MKVHERPPGERRDLRCPYGDCGQLLHLRLSSHGWFYGCSGYPECSFTLAAHADGSPKGTPATHGQKGLRKEARDAFEALWKGTKLRGRKLLMERQRAYAWLARRLEVREVQFRDLDEAQCRKVIEVCESAAAGETSSASQGTAPH